MEQNTEELIAIRENVEVLDAQLLEMIANRRRLSERIAACKRSSLKSIRNFPVEQTRLQDLIAKGGALGLDPFSVSRFYQSIIEDSVLTQHAHLLTLENLNTLPEKPRVAYLGGPGAYSQFAALKFFSFSKKPVEEVAAESFKGVIDALEAGRADYALLPYSNSKTGLIREATDALLGSPVHAVGEVYLPIEHCLLGQNHDYPVSGLKTIYGHPEAIAQCRGYLSTLKGVTVEPVPSTSHALIKVAEGRVNEAAIGSAVAGSIFGLKAIKTNIHGDQQNITRFLVVSLAPHKIPPSVEAKTTLAFCPEGEGGGLAELLLEFHDRDIPLSGLESKPSELGPWERIYLMDIHGRPGDERVQTALDVLKGKTAFLKILGSYPTGRVSNFFGN